MMSQIGWIDFSKKDRQRLSRILHLLEEKDAVDELGIGIVRDGLANKMFPGFSTLQTRARYFFITSYILYDLLNLMSSGKLKKMTPYKYLERKEEEVRLKLKRKYNEERGHGVIGIKKETLRRPSEIYWNGLNVLGFLDSYGRSLGSFLNLLEEYVGKGSFVTQPEDDDSSLDNLFNLNIDYLKGWDNNGLTLDLTSEEADFFKDALISQHGSLLPHFFNDNDLYSILEGKKEVQFEIFAQSAIEKNIPPDIKELVILSHDFALLIHGAYIAYNQAIHKKYNIDGRELSERWRRWYENIRKKSNDGGMISFDKFSMERVFTIASVKTKYHHTKSFLSKWWKLTKNGKLNDKNKIEIIKEQEVRVKGGYARLADNTKNRKIDTQKEFGLKKLSYRFVTVQKILRDIKKGLND